MLPVHVQYDYAGPSIDKMGAKRCDWTDSTTYKGIFTVIDVDIDNYLIKKF